jgi:hypothetical protein
MGQNIYPLHPSVGDTIERTEKLDYSLFSFIPNSDFDYATIVFLRDSFYLAVKSFNNESTSKEFLSKDALIEAQKSIEKINKYYRYLATKKNDTSSYQPQIRKPKAPPLRMDGPMTEQMKKEARMNVRLKDDARRQREIDQGLRQGGLFIDFN